MRINRLSILPTLVPSTSFSPSLSSSTTRVDYVFRECRSCRIMISFIVDFLMAAIYRGTSRFSVRILAGGEIGLDGAPALVELWWPIVKGEAAGGVQGRSLPPLPTRGGRGPAGSCWSSWKRPASRISPSIDQDGYGFGFLLYEQL